MKLTSSGITLLACACAGLFASTLTAAEANPFLGRWALTIPGGGAGWLGITKETGYYDAGILWGGGSVVPVSSVGFEGDTLWLARVREVKRKDAADKVVRTHQIPELIMARLEGDMLVLTQINPRDDGNGVSRREFTGQRIPDLPPAPDLSKVKYGPPIPLLKSEDLSGWKPFGSSANGWRVEKGILINEAPQEPGRHKSYANLRTEREFEDFNLTLEVRVPERGNSGIYLRGIYEVQVADSFGKAPESHQMGAVYSRITPTANACKPAGEWQTYDLTLVNRHVTVILNGQKIIDNQPLLGCTGGALWADESRPGPIYLQGDHTSVDYRNIVIRPVVK